MRHARTLPIGESKLNATQQSIPILRFPLLFLGVFPPFSLSIGSHHRRMASGRTINHPGCITCQYLARGAPPHREPTIDARLGNEEGPRRILVAMTTTAKRPTSERVCLYHGSILMIFVLASHKRMLNFAPCGVAR